MKQPFVTEVKIDGETYPLYNVTIKGIPLVVASPALADKIDECIQENHYLEEMCEMNGESCTVQEVDERFYYIFGDEDNLTPTPEEVIESIEDVMDEKEFEALKAEAERKVTLNRITDIRVKTDDNRMKVRCKIDGQQQMYVTLNWEDFLSYQCNGNKKDFLLEKMAEIHKDKLMGMNQENNRGIKI